MAAGACGLREKDEKIMIRSGCSEQCVGECRDFLRHTAGLSEGQWPVLHEQTRAMGCLWVERGSSCHL